MIGNQKAIRLSVRCGSSATSFMLRLFESQAYFFAAKSRA